MDPFATRSLGPTGARLTRLGFGGAPLGELHAKLPEDTAQSVIETAFAAGVRYFDTSPWYGHGLSEHRLGRYLRDRRRESFVISTKVGRVYSGENDPGSVDVSLWAGGLPFTPRFDYGYDGVMRSYEDSRQRLGLARVDLLLIHDLDRLYHNSEEALEARMRELEGGGMKALEELKSAGKIAGIGAGINHMGMIPRLLARFDIDFFLVAMPYTLLDQEPLEEEFPRLAEKGAGIVIGSPFASGILATGAVEGAFYNYVPAPPEILEKVGRIEAVCQRHHVPLAAAALQFPLGHACVAAVIPGAVTPDEVLGSVEMMAVDIPAALWDELKAEGLLRAEAPVP